MPADPKAEAFLSQYSEKVFTTALQLRQILLTKLPDIIEQIDLPAKMIGYCYGQKYSELICMLIPSKKGVKPSFNHGVELKDPDQLLEGKGKITRYVEIKSDEIIHSTALKNLLTEALKLYKKRAVK